MLSDYQLRNFEKYLSNCPKHYLGVQRRSLGAYDGVEGAAAHGFRRGIRIRDFGRGGAFDSAGGRNDPLENAALVFLAKKLSAEDWAELQQFLAGSETGAGDAELTSLGERDDGEESRAMDARHRSIPALDAQQRRAAAASFTELYGDVAPANSAGGPQSPRALF